MKKRKLPRAYWQGMVQHYKELFEASVSELRFEKIQKEHLNNLLDEVVTLLDRGIKPKLINKVIENGKERAVLDVMIHTDEIFNTNK